MIKYIKGDLLNCEANFLCHSTNCFITFGAGIALQIAKKYPEALEADKKTLYGSLDKLGTLSIAKTKDGKFIINAYSQFSFGQGRRVNYEAFYCCIEEVKKRMDVLYADPEKMKKLKIKKIIVGFPAFISCMLAGGSWVIIHTMLRDMFTETPYEVLIVEYNK